MHTDCITPGRSLVYGQTTKSPHASTPHPISFARFSGNGSSRVPRIRFVPTRQILKEWLPFQADNLPCTVKQAPKISGSVLHACAASMIALPNRGTFVSLGSRTGGCTRSVLYSPMSLTQLGRLELTHTDGRARRMT